MTQKLTRNGNFRLQLCQTFQQHLTSSNSRRQVQGFRIATSQSTYRSRYASTLDSNRKQGQSPRCHMTTQGQCPLCKGKHRLYQCNKFIDKLPTRLECVKQLRACFNCFQPYSKTHVCSSRSCKTCNQRHHTLLHTAMQSRSADRQGSTNGHNSSSKAKQNVNHATNNSPDEAQTYCSFKNKVTNHVLLATALVEVRNKFNQYVPCRVLLDSASQVNFITERCVHRLKLARNQSATSIQGINNVNTATHHSVSIHLRSRRTDWHTSLNVQCCQT